MKGNAFRLVIKMNDLSLYLKKLPFYDHLTDGEKALIISNWSQRNYKKGQLIYSRSDECLGHVLMCSGTVRCYINSKEGREITLFCLSPDDTCVLSAACAITRLPFDTQMSAVSDASLLVINSGVFKRLAEQNVHVKCYMYELLTNHFSYAMGAMQQIIFMGYDKRLAVFLLSELEKSENHEIKMTHEQIAQYTNSAREVVARMLKRFSSDGIVEYRRGVVTVKNAGALKNLAKS